MSFTYTETAETGLVRQVVDTVHHTPWNFEQQASTVQIKRPKG